MARRPAALDLLLALALGIEMQVELLFADGSPHDLRVAHIALFAMAVALAIRRRAPIAAAAVTLTALTVVERLDSNLDANLIGPFFASLIVTYSVGAYTEAGGSRPAWRSSPSGAASRSCLDEPPGGVSDFLFAGTIIVGGPVLLGRLVRARVKLSQALADKAAAAEDEREARAAGAVAGERARIAGELHHLVSDALASMVAEATAAEQLACTQPDGAEHAFGAVEDTGREALGEIRRLLGVLRREDEELALAPQPSLAHVGGPRRARPRLRAAGRARRRGRARAAPRRRRPDRLPRRPGGARAARSTRRIRAARRCGCATPATSSASRSPTSARRRPTASGRCSACTSASRSTAASWSPSPSTAPATRCARGCRSRVGVMRAADVRHRADRGGPARCP